MSRIRLTLTDDFTSGMARAVAATVLLRADLDRRSAQQNHPLDRIDGPGEAPHLWQGDGG